MSHQTLVTAIIDYTKLLKQAKTPCVATWKPFFITTCVDWCLLVETELAILSNEECAQVCQLAGEQCTDIPPLTELLDALHVFFLTLLQNTYTSNSLYLHLMKNYQFLTIPDTDILTKDLSQLAHEAALNNVYLDILQELEK
ncbi:unnamed protein product [Mucor hiemalis]